MVLPMRHRVETHQFDIPKAEDREEEVRIDERRQIRLGGRDGRQLNVACDEEGDEMCMCEGEAEEPVPQLRREGKEQRYRLSRSLSSEAKDEDVDGVGEKRMKPRVDCRWAGRRTVV